ncbi:DUF5054 domain-containing protein [Paenibacillus roseipurpureus]|uniref:DUF5054 domain-containing protein n=1 Tax=Paenibacillus roseopurpureus TaxID=2918901 RepID=A0AA96LNI9_9BACL|nr:DUF5054 domain-containing protein [Paenibacillus sp. MBLB1832]WNR45272.1 DUF5054 domain-containing protein [Paenibacillus sp. MBLB1832]
MDTIETVHVIFKTHLDIGFTDLAERVIVQYREQFIPKALDLAEELAAAGGEERFVWTTGSWLIADYLKYAGHVERKRMEAAILAGHIVWHGLPFTTHTELMDAELFNYGLSIAKRLDQQFGKQTISAKMTDVPGHTRAIVPLMAKRGIRYLHLGVNPASKRPAVPDLFIWRGSDGSEIIVHYANDYGNVFQLDGLRDVLVFAHTGDNCGPPSADEIRQQFADLTRRFPGAQVKASTLDAFAAKIMPMMHRLPVVEEEIGDSWIHGVGTDPYKVASYRALLRLRTSWIAQGRLTQDSEDYNQLSESLLMIPEHTWGVDIKKFLADNRHYNRADFENARRADVITDDAIPEMFRYIGAFALNEHDTKSAEGFAVLSGRRSYQFVESSWQEQRNYISKAVAVLPPDLREEAQHALAALKPVWRQRPAHALRIVPGESLNASMFRVQVGVDGSLSKITAPSGKEWAGTGRNLTGFGAFRYESLGQAEYDRWFEQYVQNRKMTHAWADSDFGKPGMGLFAPEHKHAVYAPYVEEVWLIDDEAVDEICLQLRLPAVVSQQGGAPARLQLVYRFSKAEQVLEMELAWFDKPATRLPEALWFSFIPQVDNPTRWRLDKLGERISPLDVVKDGNRNLHAVNEGIFYHGADGKLSIESLDAALVAPGAPRLLQFDNSIGLQSDGMHFQLYNNVWGTNFPMWYEEDACFRFVIKFEES